MPVVFIIRFVKALLVRELVGLGVDRYKRRDGGDEPRRDEASIAVIQGEVQVVLRLGVLNDWDFCEIPEESGVRCNCNLQSGVAISERSLKQWYGWVDQHWYSWPQYPWLPLRLCL